MIDETIRQPLIPCAVKAALAHGEGKLPNPRSQSVDFPAFVEKDAVAVHFFAADQLTDALFADGKLMSVLGLFEFRVLGIHVAEFQRFPFFHLRHFLGCKVFRIRVIKHSRTVQTENGQSAKSEKQYGK